MRLPHRLLGSLTQQRDINGIRGHQLGNEGLAQLTGVLVCRLEIHIKEMPAKTVPERYAAILQLHSLDFHRHPRGKPFPMIGNKQNPGTG